MKGVGKIKFEIRNPKSAIARWLVIVLALLAFGAVAWRLDKAPDVFTDEILYTRAGIRVADEGTLVWDNGDPLFVHPPLYFLMEGAYLWLTADSAGAVQAAGDIFAWVYQARYLNALFAGLTAATLYLLGLRLRGSWLGLLLAGPFILDPFGVRINRRAMLETLAMLLTLAGMAVLLTGGERPRPARATAVGLLLGLALLTKEITFTAPLAVLLLGVWKGREQGEKGTGEPEDKGPDVLQVPRLSRFLPVLVAGLTYGLFPLWALTTGRWDLFVHVKSVSLARLLGLVQLSGWNRPGVSLADFVLRRLADYGSTYLLLGLGGAAVLWLLLTQRHDQAGRLLAVWGLVLYPFYAFITLVGTGNDQFFYLLLVPAILFVGYATDRLWAATSGIGKATVVLGLALLLPYNAVRWWVAYGIGQDNGYRQLATYVREHLPADEPLNASGDAIKFEYFFPDRPVTDAATPEEARADGVRYFALAPRDTQSRYGRMTPELAGWIMAEGEQLFAVRGDSYGDIFLYRVDYPREQSPPAGQPRFYPPARRGSVAPFLIGLGLWIAALAGLSMTLLRPARADVQPVAWNSLATLQRGSEGHLEGET